MKTKIRRHRVSRPRSGKPDMYWLEISRQPWRNHLVAKAYHRIWEPLTEPIAKRIEPLVMWLHRRRCDGDCAEATIAKTGEKVLVCGRTPTTNARDARCYDLKEKNRQLVVDIELTEGDYQALKGVL